MVEWESGDKDAHQSSASEIEILIFNMGGGYPNPEVGRWGNPSKNVLISVLARKLHNWRLGGLAKRVSAWE